MRASSFGVLLATFPMSSMMVAAFSAVSPNPSSPAVSANPVFESLKWGGSTPDFNVMEKTMEYVGTYQKTGDSPGPEWYHKDYILRGPIIGPTNFEDLREAQGSLQLDFAFPDLKIDAFGYTIDPENPYRCFFFQRWRATHTRTLTAGNQDFEATGTRMETPVSVFSVSWAPDGTIMYEQVGAPVDRFEGNTNGKAAVFGLLHTAGLDLPAQPGDLKMRIFQRLGHLLGTSGRSWSKESDIPAWWTSKSRGADPTD